ncbi:MAG: hypothetical protein WCP39_02400 [Chlamydiota bacterium]
MAQFVKAPPKEWIEHRQDNLYETLIKNTKTSALAFKRYFRINRNEANTWRLCIRKRKAH